MLVFHAFSNDHLSRAARMYATCFNAPPWEDGWTVEEATKRLETLFFLSEGFEVERTAVKLWKEI